MVVEEDDEVARWQKRCVFCGFARSGGELAYPDNLYWGSKIEGVASSSNRRKMMRLHMNLDLLAKPTGGVETG